MEALSFRNNHIQSQPEDVKKRLGNSENFTALDTEKLKQDTVEIASKASEGVKDTVKENWFYRELRKLGVENPKKTTISALLTVGTTVLTAVIACATFGKTAKLGQTLGDDIIAKSKPYQVIGNFLQSTKKAIGNFLKKSETLNELSITYKERFAKAKLDIARGYGDGFKGIFRMTISDIVDKAFKKNNINTIEKGTELLEKLVGKSTDEKGVSIAEKLARHILKIDNAEFGQVFNKAFKSNNLSEVEDAASVIQKAFSGFAGQNKKLEKFIQKNAKNLAEGILSPDGELNIQLLQKMLNKCDVTEVSEAEKILTDILGSTAEKNGEKAVKQLANKLISGETLNNETFCQNLNLGMRKLLEAKGYGSGNKVYLSALEDLRKGSFAGNDVSEFIDVKMVAEHKFNFRHPIQSLINNMMELPGDWLIADGINKVTKGKYKAHLTGNLGSSLIKQNVVEGTLADSKIGTLIQRSIIIPMESIGNHANDMALVGAGISASCMIPLYNNVQDAPKEQVLPTILNDYVGGMGTFAISLPAAKALSYGLATLKNTDTSKSLILKLLKPIGKFFGMGLDGYVKNAKTGKMVFQASKANPLTAFIGGALRLVLVMFVFSPKVSNIIHKVVSKIFGKPYDPAEIEKQKQLEEQKNTVIPELGITQGELQQRIEKNPAAIQKMQQNPELVKAIDKNPKLLLDVLDNKEINLKETQKPQSAIQSPMLQNMIKNGKPVSNQADLFGLKTKEKTSQEDDLRPKDSATYIPNSQFSAPKEELSKQFQEQYSRLMASSDRALKNAEKYI